MLVIFSGNEDSGGKIIVVVAVVIDEMCGLSELKSVKIRTYYTMDGHLFQSSAVVSKKRRFSVLSSFLYT